MAELWLRDKKVMSYTDKNGYAEKIGKVEDPALLPLVLVDNLTPESFNDWLSSRSIPENREDLNILVEEWGMDFLRSKNYLSLSDQYWIKRRDEDWRRINYFHNRYSLDVGDAVFSPWAVDKRRLDSNSPDITTNGVLKKRWKPDADGVSVLYKAGSKVTHQEPLSEILVSVLLEQMKILPFVRYDLCVEGVTLCSKCRNFITKDTELVPFSYIYHKYPRPEDRSIYDHILFVSDKYEVPDMKEYMEGMIFIDSITGNSDRNLGNIALIRDVNTMKIIGPSPLFDFGAAYWSSGKIDIAVQSKLFGDVEKNVFARMKKKCDIEAILKSTKYAHCIETYPRISTEKKQELMEAIKKRNQILLLERQFELDRFMFR